MTSILTLPEDESTWNDLDVMFATRSGGVRRNKLSAFSQIRQNGKIAMKLDEGDSIVGVSLCTSADDVLLSSALGRCTRFKVSDVRVLVSRDSTGVRGLRLPEGDTVISMAILRAVDAAPAERAAYLRHANAMRAAASGEVEEEEAPPPVEEEGEGDEAEGPVSLSIERIAQLGAAEEFVLTVSSEGFGKRTSAYAYRRTRRGGLGMIAQDLSRRGGRLVASFPVEDTDEILLVTDQGQLIRVRVGQISIVGRRSQGVTIFRTAQEEHVVSVERLEGGVAPEEDPDDELGGEPGDELDPRPSSDSGPEPDAEPGPEPDAEAGED